MAFLQVNFFSDSLRRAVTVNVILPEESKHLIGMDTKANGPCRTLYLLHGLSDDQSIWCRRTSIERYAANRNMAVVMPNGERSWYTDSKQYGKYQTFVSNELPRVMRSFFRCMSDRREDNFIAGLSMGGYGALKIGLSNPKNYYGIAAFSAVTDVTNHPSPSYQEEWDSVFSDTVPLKGSVNDVFAVAENTAKSGIALPSIYQWCGTEDRLLDQNRDLRDHLISLGYDLTYAESAGGHTWDRWDAQIQIALDFFDKLTQSQQ